MILKLKANFTIEVYIVEQLNNSQNDVVLIHSMHCATVPLTVYKVFITDQNNSSDKVFLF